jgi:hypothetical protein
VPGDLSWGETSSKRASDDPACGGACDQIERVDDTDAEVFFQVRENMGREQRLGPTTVQRKNLESLNGVGAVRSGRGGLLRHGHAIATVRLLTARRHTSYWNYSHVNIFGGH